MSRADRHTLSPEEIRRELAALLATGYLRLLADAAPPERSAGADDEELVQGRDGHDPDPLGAPEEQR